MSVGTRTVRTTVALKFLQGRELERATSLHLKINERRTARGRPNLSLASAFKGLMYNRLQEAGVHMPTLFAQLRDPQDRRKAEALMEEVKDARTGEIGAEFRRLVEMTREQSPATARQGEEAGLFTQLELTSAKNSRERINDRREKAGQNKLNESHVLFGALMKCFLAKCRINGEDALRLLPQNVEVSRVVKWTGILEDLEFRGADPLRETILS